MTNLDNSTSSLASLLIASPIIYSNGSVDSNPGSTIVNGQPVSAVLELRSTDGALLISRMTTAERDDMNPDDGMLIYNKTDDAFNLRVAGEWVTLVSIDVNGVENDIVVFGATQGSLKDSGVTIADFFPPSEFNNINALLAPGNDIAISKLSYLQFIENSGFVFLGLQAGVQLFSQPSPQNICVLVTDGGIPPSPSSSSCAFEINTRNGALLLSRMPQTTDVDGHGVDQLANPRDGMMIFNSTSKTVQARRDGNNIGVGGVWSNVSTNPQNLKVVQFNTETFEYEMLLTDDVISADTSNTVNPIITLPENPQKGQTYTIYDGNGGISEDANFIKADGNGKFINGEGAQLFQASLNVPDNASVPFSISITPNGVRAYVGYDHPENVVLVIQNASGDSIPTQLTNVGAGASGAIRRARSVAVTSNGLYVICCNYGDRTIPNSSSVSVLDNATTGTPSYVGNITIQSTSQPAYPWDIVITSNDFLYILLRDEVSGFGVIQVYQPIDPDNGEWVYLKSLTVPEENAYQLFLTPNSNSLYVTPPGGVGQAYVNIFVNVSSTGSSYLGKALLGAPGTGAFPRSIAFSQDGSYAYVSSLLNFVYVLENASSTGPEIPSLFNTITSLCPSSAMAMTPNGKYLYVGNQETTNSVLILKDPSTGNPSLLLEISIPLGTNPASIAITPDGNFAYIANYSSTSGQYYITRIRNASTTPVVIIDDTYDGSQLIFNGTSWNAFHMPSKPGSD